MNAQGLQSGILPIAGRCERHGIYVRARGLTIKGFDEYRHPKLAWNAIADFLQNLKQTNTRMNT